MISNVKAAWSSFSTIEKRNIALYIIGIMCYKFALESYLTSINNLAVGRFGKGAQALGILVGFNQAMQCVGSILVAPVVRWFSTKGVLSTSIWLFAIVSALIPIVNAATGGLLPTNEDNQNYGDWNANIIFPIFLLSGVFHGIVELIRRVIPRDVVGGDVEKLKRMDATVHIFYEVAGTGGAFFAAYLQVTLGYAYSPVISPPLFLIAGCFWYFIRIEAHSKEALAELRASQAGGKGDEAFAAENPSLMVLVRESFVGFFRSVWIGGKIVMSSRKFMWLIPGYSLALVMHRYLESQLFPNFAKRVLKTGAYSSIMTGGSNFGELCGALSVLLFTNAVKTPIPWLRWDALTLSVVWVLPYWTYTSDPLGAAWAIAAIFVGVSAGWAAGDVSLAAYVQSRLDKYESKTSHVSALGAVMSFLYSIYIVVYAIIAPLLGTYMDDMNKKGQFMTAIKY
eukprot:Colp12_sorted_trinity150504_noHs@16414